MPTLNIELKQHTPLIHFQHKQEGATLRASEVKPKLDKYIIKHEFQDNFDSCMTYLLGYNSEKEEELRSKWNAGFRALDYKMRIESSGEKDLKMEELEEPSTKSTDETGEKLYSTPDYPNEGNLLILGNMGGRPKDKLLNFVMYDNIIIRIHVHNDDLLEKIQKYITNFVKVTNFGNRTSKGFGSFLVTSINPQPENASEAYNTNPKSVSFTLEKITDDGEAYKDIYIIINKIWTKLKNGNKGKSSVFLGVTSNLTGNEARIPSPIYFKPTIENNNQENWKVTIYILFNEDVITRAGVTKEAFNKIINKRLNKFMGDLKDYKPIRSQKINNIKLCLNTQQ